MDYFSTLDPFLTLVSGIIILIAYSRRPESKYQAPQIERLCPKGHVVAPGEKSCPICRSVPDADADRDLWTCRVNAPATPWDRIVAGTIDGSLLSGAFYALIQAVPGFATFSSSYGILATWAFFGPYFILCWGTVGHIDRETCSGHEAGVRRWEQTFNRPSGYQMHCNGCTGVWCHCLVAANLAQGQQGFP
jgi:hypothetical protein